MYVVEVEVEVCVDVEGSVWVHAKFGIAEGILLHLLSFLFTSSSWFLVYILSIGLSTI